MGSVMNLYRPGDPSEAPDFAPGTFCFFRTIGEDVLGTHFGPDLALLPQRASSVTVPKPNEL